MHESTHEQLKQSVEIERKFLVSELPPNIDDYEHAHMQQGYLAIATDGSEARIRNSNGSCTLTAKSGGSLVRTEFGTEISQELFNVLWPSTEGKRIEKQRYKIPHENVVIELDVYLGKLTGLLTAEVEFPDVVSSSAFLPPEWMKTDVTEDKRLKNQTLTLNGLPL